MGNFRAYNSGWRLALAFLVGVGFVVLGLWIAGVFGELHGPQPGSHRRRYSLLLAIPGFNFAFGWFCALLFGWKALGVLKKL